jgi:hypothetical protein
MKKIFLILSAFISSSVCLFAQSEKSGEISTTSKAVYGEFGGSGLLFSANFDSRFKGSKGLGFRVGIGGAGGTGGAIITFPFGLNVLTGENAHHFEGGLTATFLTGTGDLSFGDTDASTWIFMPHLGYRYSKPSNSFNGRIYVGPLIFNGAVFFPFGGLSIGYTFK